MDPACPDCKYPFNVSIQTYEYDVLTQIQPFNQQIWGDSHFCQGALIHPNWVLTTADCASGQLYSFGWYGFFEGLFGAETPEVEADEIWVEIGLHNVNVDVGTESIAVENIFIYPGYQGTIVDNYALLELAQPSTFEPISLISDETLDDDGQDAIVAGWGSRTGGNFLAGEGVGYLDYNHLLIENNAVVDDCYYWTEQWELLGAGENFICVEQVDYSDDFGGWWEIGAQGGACWGDNGAPFFITNENEEYELIGLFTVGCSDNGQPPWMPAMYSGVFPIKDWIASYIGGATVDISINAEENPEYISWEFWYKGETLDSGISTLLSSGDNMGSQITIQDEGVYEFIIFDGLGEGLGNEGGYQITLDEAVVAQGGYFGAEESTLFAWHDFDNDLIIDSLDNCSGEANPYQNNYDGDTQGDACDFDDDNDSVIDLYDPNDQNPLICGDSDDDNCDDCTSGVFDIENDCFYDQGDVNQDNSLDVIDIVIIVGFIIGNVELSDDQFELADSNADGAIDVLDVIILMNIIIGD